MTRLVHLSVVVCTYNRAGLLRSCLESLVDQTLPPEYYEVVVVDNNSTDETQSVIACFAGHHSYIRGVVEENQGLSHARNLGWNEAAGQYVAFIDDDAKADPEWCERILRAFEEVEPRPLVVGGKISPWYECPPPEWFIDEFETRTWGETAHFLTGMAAKGGFSGSNMAFQSELLKSSGGFSPAYGMVGDTMSFGEEKELFSRIYGENSCFWYDPAIKVYHWTPSGNMSVLYHMKRNYLAGGARFGREKGKLVSREYWRCLSLSLLQLVRLPVKFLFTSRNRKTEVASCLFELSWYIAYVLGGFRFGWDPKRYRVPE